MERQEDTSPIDVPSAEYEEVLFWRLEQFSQLGFAKAEAVQLAASAADLAQARSLVDHGCSPELAHKILA